MIRDHPFNDGGHVGNIVTSMKPRMKVESCTESYACMDCPAACTGTLNLDRGRKGSGSKTVSVLYQFWYQ